MNTIHAKKKTSFLSIALGSLIITGLGIGSTEALPFSCTLKCSKSSVSKDATRLNDCATKCDNIKIIDILRLNASKLNEANKKHFLDSLKYKQSLQEKEHTKIAEQLKAELAKKKPSQSKINDLNKKQDKFIAEINNLKTEITTVEQTAKAPPRPTIGPRPSFPNSDTSKEEVLTTASQAFKFMGLPETATATEVRTKYKSMALMHHPDKNGDSEMFKKLSTANEILKKHFETHGASEAEDFNKPPTDMPPPPPHSGNELSVTSQPPTDILLKIEDMHGHQAASKGHDVPSNQPKQPPTLLEQIQAAKDLKLKKVQTKESPNVGAGKVIGTDQPTTETAEHPLTQQSGGSSQSKQPPTLLEQIQAGKQLKKVDKNAPRSPDNARPQVEPEKTLQQQLEEAMAARRGSMNGGEKKT